MAGVDKEFEGESRLSDWAKVGYLEQEPKLEDGDTVASNIEAAVVPTRTLLKEYEQVKKGRQCGAVISLWVAPGCIRERTSMRPPEVFHV